MAEKVLEDYILAGDTTSIANLLYDHNLSFKNVILSAINLKSINKVSDLLNYVDYSEISDIISEIKDINSLTEFAALCSSNGIETDSVSIFKAILLSGGEKMIKNAMNLMINEIDFKNRGLEYFEIVLKRGDIKVIKAIYKKCIISGIFKNIDMVIKNLITACFESNCKNVIEWFLDILADFEIDFEKKIKIKNILKDTCVKDNDTACSYILDRFSKNIDVHERGELYFRTACECGSLKVAKMLYNFCKENGDEINVYSYNNYAFEKACWNNHLETVKWLDSIGCVIDISDGDHSIFENTFKNNNKEVADWFTERYPIYRLSSGGGCTCSACVSRNKKYIIDEMNYLEKLFIDKKFDEVKKYLGKRGIIQLKQNPDYSRECIICSDETDVFINVGCGFDDHLYCAECLSKNFKINYKKKCLICNKEYKDTDVKLVEIVE